MYTAGPTLTSGHDIMTSDSLEAQAGQVLIVGFPAGPLPTALADRASGKALGGFILFRRNLVRQGGEQLAPRELAAQNAALIAASPDELPPIIAIDQEGGRVARLKAPLL